MNPQTTLLTRIKRWIPLGARRRLGRLAYGARDRALAPINSLQARRIGSRVRHAQAGRRTVLFFAPEAAIDLYMRTHAALAHTLQAQGHNVLFVRCFDVFPRCPVKDMLLLRADATPAEHRAACLACHRSSSAFLRGHGFDFFDLRELVSAEALGRIEAALRTAPAAGFDLDYDGINVGALAFYDFAILQKHPRERAMDERDRAIWLAYVKSVMLSIEAVSALAGRMKLDVVACFDEYGMMSGARLAGIRAGARPRLISVSFHLDGDPRRPVALSNLTVTRELAWRREQWPQWRDLALTPEAVAQAVDDLVVRLIGSGPNVYSPNKTAGSDLRAALRLDPARKLLVAYTSSVDEYDALKANLRGLGLEAPVSRDAFADTFAWLDFLIPYVEASTDLQLVVRIHPRVGATARDRLPSNEYERYRRELGRPLRHCRVVWPEEKVSSYDLAEIADLALVSWSALGLELARLGVPVLSGNRSVMTIAPESSFIALAETREEYQRMLRELLRGYAHPAAQLRAAFRWYNMFHLGNTIDMRDTIAADGKANYAARPRHAALVEDIFIRGAEAITGNLAELRAAQGPGALERETEALARQVRRLTGLLATGRDPGADYALPAAGERHSTMVARLLRIHAELSAEGA